MTKALTIAQQIASRYDEDGGRWTRVDKDGETHDILDEAMAEQVRMTEYSSTSRHEFTDGSALVIADSGWDYAHPDGCFCMAGSGHDQGCPHAADADL